MDNNNGQKEALNLEKTIIECANDGKGGFEDLKKYTSELCDQFWEVEGLCVLMRTDVLNLGNWEIFGLFIGTSSMSSEKVRHSLMKLIDSYVNEMKTSKQHRNGLYDRMKMFYMLKLMVAKGGKVIDDIGDKIFEYMATVLEVCEDESPFWVTADLLSKFDTSTAKCWWMQRLEWLMSQLGVEVVNWTVHRNVVGVIWQTLKCVDGYYGDQYKNYYSSVLNQQVSDQMLNYMMKLLDSDEHGRAQLVAIENLELMCVTNLVKKDSEDKLRTKLSNIGHKIESAALLPKHKFNSVEHQVGWCARWCVQNVWDEEGRVDKYFKLPLIKLSPDRFEARYETRLFPIVRSSFVVSSGVYYYEVALITQEMIRIGWSTRESTFGYLGDTYYRVGDDENSIALEVGNNTICIYHSKNLHLIKNLPVSQLPNVVGCLIDTPNRQFVFYLNGHKIDCQKAVHFSTSPYYASVSLNIHEQCRFNFGQEQFKYPPQEVNFQSFCEVTNGDVKKFQLVDTEVDNLLSWFKHPVVDNQVDRMYCDQKQNEHDDFVREHEHHFSNKQTHEIDLTRVDCSRFIQSVIEVMQSELNDDQCIRDTLTSQLSLHKNQQLYTFTGKMFELISPYTQLQVNPQNKAKSHNLGIILTSILNLFPDIPPVIYQMSLTFLLSTKLISIETLKRNAQLVTSALTGFDAFRLNERNKRTLLKNQTFALTLKSIEQYGQIDSISSLYESSCDSQAVQAGLCAKWLYDRVVSDSNESFANRDATLNPKDRSAFLKLSSDRLSARSDCHWQSVRSIDHVPSDVYYFEVILLTDGPMRIGWATKRTRLNESQIGKDHLSISFDGFTRAVRHQGEVYQVGDIEPWKAGDVIGCAIDKGNGQFRFFLNGQALTLPPHLHFSSLPYHAAVSLSSHQQVYCNFGQAPFKYSPQQIDYWDFHIALSYHNNKPAIDFGNAHLSQTVISINSTVTTGDISIKRQSYNFHESTTSNLNSNKRTRLNSGHSSQLDCIDETTLQSSQDPPSIVNPRAECRLCTEPTTTKLLRFACCPNLILCIDCVKLVSQCPKCSKQPNNAQSPSTSSSPPILPVSECRLCFEQIQIRNLLFLCCGAINLCLDCLKPIVECPKCRKTSSSS